MAKRKSRTKQRRAPRSKVGPEAVKRKGKPKQVRPPRGQVGPQTYDQVRKVVDEKKIPIGKAFDEVARATGRTPGTVAVTYYRVAKQKGGPRRKRRGGRAAGRTAGRGRRATAAGTNMSGIKTVLSRVAAAIKELETVIARQAREIGRLKGESRLADRIRKALRE